MLDVIVIEDEKPAVELLSQTLGGMPADIFIKARLHSVKESIAWFSEKPEADLIFSDVRLADGLAFDIFENAGVGLPVIFVTGYDKYFIRAFETNGIDYLLQPFDKKDIEKVIAKHNSLKSYFTNNRTGMLLHNLEDFINKRKKTRLVVKNGLENVSLLVEDIALLFAKDNMAYVIDRFSKKYLSDKTLTELEEELDKPIFFRANRQYIINIGFVKSFTSLEKVLLVELSIPGQDPITINQVTALKFREWMQEV